MIGDSLDDPPLSVEVAARFDRHFVVVDDLALVVADLFLAMMTKQIFGQRKEVTILRLDEGLVGFEVSVFGKQSIGGEKHDFMTFPKSF